MITPPSPISYEPKAPAMPGSGTLLTQNAIGTSTSVREQGGGFPFNFRPALGGLTLRLSYGSVDGAEPTIKKLPMSQTVLPLLPSQVNDKGESWACIEVEPDAATGRLTAGSRVEIVHTKEPEFFTPKIGRCAVTLILWRHGRPYAVQHILKFCVRYYRLKETTSGPEFYRHLFL